MKRSVDWGKIAKQARAMSEDYRENPADERRQLRRLAGMLADIAEYLAVQEAVARDLLKAEREDCT